jgi:hypothetical protein
MDLTEALAQTAPKKGPTCSVGKFLATLDSKARAQVEDACANVQLQTAHLTRALAMMAGTKFDPQTVSRHRKGSCNCGS